MDPSEAPAYLQPYLKAAARHGSGFGSLLWASPRTQAIRFAALLQAAGNASGKVILDVGCGRADLLDFMLSRGVYPRRYIGLEAVEELAVAAENKRRRHCEIVRGDFVRDPAQLCINADILLFSGSLNTLDEPAFYQSVASAFDAATEAVVFNFLASPFLAASSHLTWHPSDAVLAFAGKLSKRVRLWENYLKGDATIAIRKELLAT